VLGHRIEPGQGGHDANGFRNAGVPAQVGVVAIGDSQTYGVSAPRDGSWPQQLSGLIGEPVYNMGLGGYSPPDYLALAQREAPKLKPRQWLVGVYLGNDMMEACWAVEQRAHWAAWRSSAQGMCSAGPVVDEAGAPKRFGAFREWLARKSVLYGVLKATVFARLGEREQKNVAVRSSPDAQFPWVDRVRPQVRTTFRPQGRLAVLDLQARGVQEGLRISKLALTGLRAEADRQGVKLLVMLIPTKERVYCDYLTKSGDTLPGSFTQLCGAEDRVKAELVRHMGDGGIAFVDVLPPLQERVARHEQIYPANADGHPLALGYGAMARAVAEVLKQR
jgi:lysophospholipase L1-like esterase